MTRAPRAVASWTARVPTAPDAPCISTVSPADGLQHPGANLAVQRVQSGGLHPDPDLARTGLRDLDVRLVQHIRAAKLVENDCLHDDSILPPPKMWLDT